MEKHLQVKKPTCDVLQHGDGIHDKPQVSLILPMSCFIGLQHAKGERGMYRTENHAHLPLMNILIAYGVSCISEEWGKQDLQKFQSWCTTISCIHAPH